MDRDDSSPSNIDVEFHEFFDLMKQTTTNLKKMAEAQRHMRWQFGEPKEFLEFVTELNETLDGWVSSSC